MRYGQVIPYLLPTQSYSAGSRTTQTLRDLPKQLLGRLTHLVKFTFSVAFTPTYSSSPSVAQMNNVFTAADFWDGQFMRFQGGFNHLRAKERMQSGRLRLPDADTSITSTNPRYFAREFFVGPTQMAGSPADFIVPTGVLENAELRFTHGSTSDTSTSALTATVRVIAWLMLMDEIRIPPAYQFVNQTLNASDVNFAGRALYESISLFHSTSFDAWSAGDVGNVRLDLGQGDVIPNIKASDLRWGMTSDFNSGSFDNLEGDPENATYDVASKKVNRGTPTALTSVDQDLQPVLWTPPEGRISKMWLAESTARLRWDGANTSGIVACLSRILSQPASVAAATLQKALGRLNITQKSVDIKTLSKRPYKGPYGEFMPWVAKV